MLSTLRRFASTAVLMVLAAAILAVPSATAQTVPITPLPFNGAQSSIFPNYSQVISSLTGSGQSAIIALPGATTGMIEVKATALTTVTWQVSGSIDGGKTFFPLNVAPYTVLPLTPVVATVTSTAAAGTLFVTNIAGMTNLKITTSGTFTATGLQVVITTTSNKGLL